MYIPNDDTQNDTTSVDVVVETLRLNTQLNKLTNQKSLKVPKVVEPTNNEL